MKSQSIQVKLVITITGFLILAIFMCWFMNLTFLKDYYTSTKINDLGTVYEQTNEIYGQEDEILDEENLNLEVERMAAKKNMSLYVFNIYYNSFLTSFLQFIYPSNLNTTQAETVKKRVEEYINDYSDKKHKKTMEELVSEENYSIYKVYDERIQSYYIELYGSLSNDATIYIRTNFESMQDSVNISNKFLAYIGIVIAVLGAIFMFFVGRSFTNPILELSDIAKRISNLDFEARYDKLSNDEIGILGESINTLSKKLETTISELKSANNELQSDIENKIQIDEMRKEFLSNVSHELKTPIALIQGYAEGLKENINDDVESRDFYCEVIMDEADKMNKMVKKLLSLNQIEFGNNQVAMERFDIVSLVKSVVFATDIMAQQKEAAIILEEQEPIYVWADEYMIEEVVTNYISNAYNHLAGDKIIEINLWKKEEVVRISVFNTGEPIPEEDLDKIWIKFYKVDKARTREYGGSGIGLSIVKAIMNSHNRECGVINHNNGVEFWFELDIKNEE